MYTLTIRCGASLEKLSSFQFDTMEDAIVHFRYHYAIPSRMYDMWYPSARPNLFPDTVVLYSDSTASIGYVTYNVDLIDSL